MLVSFVIALAIIGGTLCILVKRFRSLRAKRLLSCGILFAVVCAAALAVGIRFGVFGEFDINERTRMQGAPIPLVIFVLEGENWTDFVKPRFVSYVCLIANALFPVGLVAALLKLPFGTLSNVGGTRRG